RPFMAFYGAEFFTDTAHLSRDERDAYLRLIWHYWSHGGLLDDDARLARIAQMSPDEWAAARPVIQAFFRDGWKHRRIDDEIARANELSEAKQRAGVARGLQRRRRQNEQKEHLFNRHSPARPDACDDAARTETNNLQ